MLMKIILSVFFFDINSNEKFISDKNYDRIVPTMIFDRNSNSIEKVKKILKIHRKYYTSIFFDKIIDEHFIKKIK